MVHLMNRIENTIKKSEKCLIGYFMCGEFTHNETLKVMHEGVKSGLDCIEIGFPFSDPTADGTTIQESAQKSLSNGTTVADAFSLILEFRKINTTTPVIMMGYFNIVFQYGLENFARACKKSGVDGLIIVDLPVEESPEFEQILEQNNIILIQIVSFLTDSDRFKQIEKRARGFVYLVSTLGVTGQAKPMLTRIASYTKQVQARLPIVVGFGISSPQSAMEISQYCDGVVVGSHFIKCMREGGITKVTESIKEIKDAVHISHQNK